MGGRPHPKMRQCERREEFYKNTTRIKDLSVRADTIKLLEENIGRTLFDIIHSNILLDLSPRAKEMKAKVNQWYLIRLKAFAQQKKKKH